MCRLLGVVSREPISLDQAVAEEIEPFTQQSELHKDGWGVAWYAGEEGDGAEVGDAGPTRAVEKGGAGPADGATARAATPAPLHNPRRPQIRRHLDAARESAAYAEAIRAARGPMMLVHLRRASPGLPLEIRNTHPFHEGETVFAHNGQFDLSDSLRAAVLARGGRRPEGTTDSELFFSLIELHARETDPATAVQRAAAELTALSIEHSGRVPEAMNCLYMTPDQMVAYQQHDPPQARRHGRPDVYSLRYRIDADRVIVASSGIPQTEYLEVGEGCALVIDRADLSVSLHPPLT